eukprot:7587288-Pyramimonas_sp.AAC.1
MKVRPPRAQSDLDQSDAASAGIFSPRTNRTQYARDRSSRVSAKHGPRRCIRKRRSWWGSRACSLRSSSSTPPGPRSTR